MNTDFAAAQVFTDVQGLAKLKLAARNEDAGSLNEAAKQFEALFINLMLKTMREANVKSGLFDSDQMQFHQEMFDQQLAVSLGEKRSLGIADMLVRQLGKNTGETPRPDPFNEMLSPAMTREDDITHVRDKPGETHRPDEPDQFDNPQDFISYMRPLAEKVAAQLGIDTNVLIAQSALETGWGKKIIRNSDGTSSHNLFGIKSHRDWQGPSARVNTVEYVDGTMQKTRDSFRVYESYADSFADYAEFLASNPRYQDAMNKTGNSHEFIRALQTAGYATDPQYADKVLDIMDRHAI
ncbi:MAG: flagellar assembly peptidoglycan hydrolase FlgJ [Thiotrichales bacterium]|nr:flagellar assembly peptidoglycan hydrolase FlgJ [Thiotrichales bacterium]